MESERGAIRWLKSIRGEKRLLNVLRHLRSVILFTPIKSSASITPPFVIVLVLSSSILAGGSGGIRQLYIAGKAKGLLKPSADELLAPNTEERGRARP